MMYGLVEIHCLLPTAHCLLSAAFLTPWFFGAGAALMAIPIIIHILNRRRFKVVRWAAMEYLLQAMRKNRRRLKFEQWLLLAIRCALLLLLGIALARPLWNTSNSLGSLAGQRNGLHVFIIDNSYSMAYEVERPGAKTHLEQAKILAKGMMDKLVKGGESVAIVTASHPATAIIAKPSYSIDACHAAIEGIEQTYGGTDLPNAIAKAVDIARDEQKQPNKNLWIITDGTHSAFEGAQAEALKAAGRDVKATFGDRDQVHLFNLGRPDQWNQAVLDLRPVGNLITTKFNADFVGTARSYGNGPDPIMQWQIDGHDVPGAGIVKLDAGAPLLLSNQPIKAGGPHVVSLNILSDDRLKFDNTRYRVADVASELKVLIVEGERGFGGVTGSGAFLQTALSPAKSQTDSVGDGPGAKTNSAVAAEMISDLELGNRVLGDYRAVILADVGQIPDAQADQLQRYVEQGGRLMLFMGPHVNAENYNSVLLNQKRSLLPGRLVKAISAGSLGVDAFFFDFKPDGNVPIYLNEFKGLANSGLSTARTTQYWQLEVTNPSAERVLNYLPVGPAGTNKQDANSAAEDPAITIHPVGKGRVTFFATTANADWASFMVKQMFLPLIQEVLLGSIGSQDGWMNINVGDPVEVPTLLGLSTPPTLSDASKKDIAVFAITKDGQTSYRSRPLTKPGIYTLSTGNQSYPIAVNVPSDEADVRTLADGAIKKALGDLDFSSYTDQLPAEATKLSQGRDLGWSCMLIVLVLAAVECFAAMQFGHYRRAAHPQAA